MNRRLWTKTFLPDGTSHEDWLAANHGKYTLPEICELLGRNRPSVSGKLRNMGLEAKAGDPGPAPETVSGVPTADLLSFLKDEPRSLRDLSERFNRSESTMTLAIGQLQSLSYEIMETQQERLVWSTEAPGVVSPPETLWDESIRELIFGCISDPHFGSKWAQITNLRRTVEEMWDLGVRHILWPGDIYAGNGRVYRGQIRDLYTSSGDEQVELAREYIPEREGLHHYLMGGNHGWSFVRSGGFNPVRSLCKQRDDMTYVGFDLVDVPLTPNVDARLWHPMGGVPYAYSYRGQKLAEQTAFEELTKALEKKQRPTVRFILAGHLHIMLDFWQGPIFLSQVGCFEGKTNYLKRRGLTPHIGAMVFRVTLTTDGWLVRDLDVKYLRFEEIEDDYLNYPIPREEIEIQPLFQWTEEETENEKDDVENMATRDA